ncbi:ROK family transcriptional regulator [Clavibacter lycopersici]|uniref:ROK family transcriptional regulator n=2 Tax=Clavibacter lycopersici TaxID=2301718 RepID=A0A399TFG1_9MICO|nr:ROK family transcriptional regulator [Clavibacter lycopersici]RIJ59441.1 ROK family transcriptional regulator [Clavibacter lycopersici]
MARMPTELAPAASGPAGTRTRRVVSKSLPQHNRVHNRSMMLQALFHRGAMSRADLARESGLTRPTVSVLVSELAADGIVAEVGQREDARVGKPAQLVEIDADSFHIVALDLSNGRRFVGAVMNLRGEVLAESSLEVDGATGDAAVAKVVRLSERLVAQTPRRLLGIAVGVPGIVDDQGVVREALDLEWSDVPLRARLADHFRVPVRIANDANLSAVGMHMFSEAPGQSVMVVTIEDGVGVGLVIGGALVQGEQFAAGEIGHVTVGDPGVGEACTCGRSGCLETVIGARYLARRIAGLTDDARDAALRDAGSALGVVIAPVISALNLNHVVVTGPRELIEGPLRDATLATIRARTLSSVGDALSLRMSDDDADLVLLGGASLMLQAELGVY